MFTQLFGGKSLGNLLGSLNQIVVKIKVAVIVSLFYLFHGIMRLLPKRTLVRLKANLSPIVQLDYRRHRILLHADSPLGLYRARACQKEPETVRWIEEFVRPGDVFYDIGANVGAYSLIASKYCGGVRRLTLLYTMVFLFFLFRRKITSN